MAPHYSTPAWKIPWTEEPGRLQSMGSLRVGHDWATSLSLFTFMHWRRKWQPTPVFLPGESQGWGSLVGCRLWGSHRVGHDWNDLAARWLKTERSLHALPRHGGIAPDWASDNLDFSPGSAFCQISGHLHFLNLSFVIIILFSASLRVTEIVWKSALKQGFRVLSIQMSHFITVTAVC